MRFNRGALLFVLVMLVGSDVQGGSRRAEAFVGTRRVADSAVTVADSIRTPLPMPQRHDFGGAVLESPMHGTALRVAMLTPPSTQRARANLVAIYRFQEKSGRVVHDDSRAGSPLQLQIRGGDFSWKKDGGLEIGSPVLIESPALAKELVQAIKNSGELTIEAWICPRDRFQGAPPPGRIVSLSTSPTHRNFTLGQERDRYSFRLRTSRTNANGTTRVLHSAERSAQTHVTHVVYTFAHNEARLYLNAQEVDRRQIDGDFSNWNDYQLALANEITRDRPWLGTLYLVAIYSRALQPDEVQQNFAAGHR